MQMLGNMQKGMEGFEATKMEVCSMLYALLVACL